MATPNDQNWGRIWLLPLSILMGAGLSVFVMSYWLDAGDIGSLWGRLIHPNPTSGQDALGGAAEVISAVLGIAITVVAIVVELAANRYTHRITELFVSEPINFLVTGFFVISALQAVFVGLTFETLPTGDLGFVPRWGIVVSMSMLALCLLLLLPYFAFVFAFLSPIAIVHRIQRHQPRRGKHLGGGGLAVELLGGHVAEGADHGRAAVLGQRHAHAQAAQRVQLAAEVTQLAALGQRQRVPMLGLVPTHQGLEAAAEVVLGHQALARGRAIGNGAQHRLVMLPGLFGGAHAAVQAGHAGEHVARIARLAGGLVK